MKEKDETGERVSNHKMCIDSAANNFVQSLSHDDGYTTGE